MKKEDLVKVSITIDFKKRDKSTGEIKPVSFTTNLQSWIKLNPDEQDNVLKDKLENHEELVGDYTVN